MLIIKDRLIPIVRSAGGALALLFFLGFSTSVSGQNVNGAQDDTKNAPIQTTPSLAPRAIASVYKEVKIGTSAEEVRELLGKAKIDDKDGFFYDTDSELVQIRLDENAKVRLVSVTYASKNPNVPKYSDIFGDEPMNAKPNGAVYKLVRYPEAGYWVAYSKTGGDEPTVTVTMQKL